MPSDAAIEWLLDSDPALRWQVERDLLDLPHSIWQATRSRISSEGFGSRLLAHQDSDGQWDNGAFFPGGKAYFDLEERPPGQPWTTTTWTLNSLREFGLDPIALAGTAEKLQANSRWEYNDEPYWAGEVDCCINSWTLSNGLWLGADVDHLVDWFLEHEMGEGGWNCEWVEGDKRASFHSTLNSLKGLLDYQIRTGDASRVRGARRRGEEYLLQRHLLNRLTTGERVGSWTTEFAWPFRWVYSALNAADYFRAASIADGTPPDSRIEEAIRLIRSSQQPDGSWLQQDRHEGKVWFEMDAPVGEPSKWLTFYALRTLRWWDESR